MSSFSYVNKVQHEILSGVGGASLRIGNCVEGVLNLRKIPKKKNGSSSYYRVSA